MQTVMTAVLFLFLQKRPSTRVWSSRPNKLQHGSKPWFPKDCRAGYVHAMVRWLLAPFYARRLRGELWFHEVAPMTRDVKTSAPWSWDDRISPAIVSCEKDCQITSKQPGYDIMNVMSPTTGPCRNSVKTDHVYHYMAVGSEPVSLSKAFKIESCLRVLPSSPCWLTHHDCPQIIHKLHLCAKRLKCISCHQIYYNTPLSTNLTGKSTLLALKYSQTFFPSVS